MNTFSPMDYALPETIRLLDTWKICFAAHAIQCSGLSHWIIPWIHTF